MIQDQNILKRQFFNIFLHSKLPNYPLRYFQISTHHRTLIYIILITEQTSEPDSVPLSSPISLSLSSSSPISIKTRVFDLSPHSKKHQSLCSYLPFSNSQSFANFFSRYRFFSFDSAGFDRYPSRDSIWVCVKMLNFPGKLHQL